MRRTVPSRRKWFAVAVIDIGGHDRIEVFCRVTATGSAREQAIIKTFPGRKRAIPVPIAVR